MSHNYPSFSVFISYIILERRLLSEHIYTEVGEGLTGKEDGLERILLEKGILESNLVKETH